MRTKYVWEKILPVSVGLMLYELAAGSSFYLMELSFVLLAGSFFVGGKKNIYAAPQNDNCFRTRAEKTLLGLDFSGAVSWMGDSYSELFDLSRRSF